MVLPPMCNINELKWLILSPFLNQMSRKNWPSSLLEPIINNIHVMIHSASY